MMAHHNINEGQTRPSSLELYSNYQEVFYWFLQAHLFKAITIVMAIYSIKYYHLGLVCTWMLLCWGVWSLRSGWATSWTENLSGLQANWREEERYILKLWSEIAQLHRHCRFFTHISVLHVTGFVKRCHILYFNKIFHVWHFQTVTVIYN